MKKIFLSLLLLIILTACENGLIPNNNHLLEPGMVCTIGNKQYSSLMEAINDASDQSIINLFQSITEEIYIENKRIEIVGKADNVIISKPNQLKNTFTTSRNQKTYGIIIVKGGDVTIENVTIDGQGQVDNSQQTVGIGVIDANITLRRVKVINIYEAEVDLEANNNGIGILIQNTDDLASSVTITNCVISNFQKGVIYFYNSNIIDGFQLEVSNNFIKGTGYQSVVPQTGLLLAGAAMGKIENNQFSDLCYGPETVKAQGIVGIDIDVTKIIMKDNTFLNVDQETSFNS